MSTTYLDRESLAASVDTARRVPSADAWLRRSGQFWYAVALVGQVAFVAFIVMFYVPRTVGGDFATWNDKELIVGHVEGDGLGNFMFITHVLGATIISLGGMLQLLPAIRKHAPAVHRWLGRAFMVMALLMATGGIMMTWLRARPPSVIGAGAITLDGALILLFAAVAWRLAVLRQIDAHSRWAMRTFMVANGVWFLRVMTMGWAIATGGVGVGGRPHRADFPRARVCVLPGSTGRSGTLSRRTKQRLGRNEASGYRDGCLVDALYRRRNLRRAALPVGAALPLTVSAPIDYRRRRLRRPHRVAPQC